MSWIDNLKVGDKVAIQLGNYWYDGRCVESTVIDIDKNGRIKTSAFEDWFMPDGHLSNEPPVFLANILKEKTQNAIKETRQNMFLEEAKNFISKKFSTMTVKQAIEILEILGYKKEKRHQLWIKNLKVGDKVIVADEVHRPCTYYECFVEQKTTDRGIKVTGFGEWFTVYGRHYDCNLVYLCNPESEEIKGKIITKRFDMVKNE